MEKAEKLKVLTSAKIGEAFSDEAASAAASRLKQRLAGTQLYGGIPADALADLAIIAANKVKNGVTDFAEFSSQMVKEYGEKVRPELQKLYQDTMEKVFGNRRNLDLQEVSGGHTIEKHIGKSESWLRKRLESDPALKNTNYASSFRNRSNCQ
jgi:hypothetical protein